MSWDCQAAIVTIFHFMLMDTHPSFSVGSIHPFGSICWQGDGHSILGCKRHYNVRLFTQEMYNNWSVLCKLVRQAENCHQ